MTIIDRIKAIARTLSLDRGIIELSERIFNDVKPKLQCAYLFAQTADNQESVFRAAHSMQENHLAHLFLIPDVAAINGYPGRELWETRLRQQLGHDHVSTVPFNGTEFHTLTESLAVVRNMQQRNEPHLYVVAAPFHQLRAYMTLATIALRVDDELSLVSYPGTELPWDEKVLHSQGKLKATRSELLQLELQKIKTYQEKGDILPTIEILDHMDRRKLLTK